MRRATQTWCGLHRWATSSTRGLHRGGRGWDRAALRNGMFWNVLEWSRLHNIANAAKCPGLFTENRLIFMLSECHIEAKEKKSRGFKVPHPTLTPGPPGSFPSVGPLGRTLVASDCRSGCPSSPSQRSVLGSGPLPAWLPCRWAPGLWSRQCGGGWGQGSPRGPSVGLGWRPSPWAPKRILGTGATDCPGGAPAQGSAGAAAGVGERSCLLELVWGLGRGSPAW